uniref:Uncharacterized protein n=1 Tax=Malurus cyaneus samueli TaxID=2593467 RepID=A0A8C5TFM7_9PASS
MDGWLQFREVSTENCQRHLERKMLFTVTTENYVCQKLGIDRKHTFKKNIKAALSREKVNGISIDFNDRFLHFSARAALDSSYVQELDGILKEARALENHLKQKRESLKQRFAVIASTLQS